MPEPNRDTILEAEFNYIAKTVFQNHEDRANVSGLYLTTVGSFVVTILSFAQDGLDFQKVRLAFAMLFTLLGLAGIRTLLELIRLRRAWFDSVYAINAIKEYYIQQQPDRDNKAAFVDAFKWRWMPKGFQTGSVSFLLAMQTTVLSSLSFGTAALFIIWTAYDKVEVILAWGVPIAVFVSVFIVELWHYRRRLEGLELNYPSPAKEPNKTP